MKSKKLIAFLCAAAMTTSAFAGLTITASAASEPVLSLDGSSTAGWTVNDTVQLTTKTDEGSTDSYLDFLSAANKNSYDTVYNLPAAAQLTDDYVIEFDTLLNTGNGMGRLNQYTQVAFTGANPGHDTTDYGGDYASSAQHLIDDNGYTNTWNTDANVGQGYTTQIAASVTSRIELQGKWIFNMKSATPNIATDGDAQIGDGKWVRVRAAVKNGKATITAADSNQVYVDEQQFDADATKLSKILLSFGRADTQNFVPTTATNIKLDNIKVYDGVANAPAFSTTGLRATAIIATPIPAAEKVAGAAPALTIPDRSGIDPVTSVQTSFNALQVGELAHIDTAAQDPVAVGDKMEVQIGSRDTGADAATYASVVKTADGDNAIKMNAGQFSTNGRGPVLSLKDNMSIEDLTGTNSVLGFSAYLSKTQADGMSKLYLFDDVDLSADGGNVDGNGVARYVLAVITTEDVKDEEGNNKYTNGDSNIGIHVDEGWHTFTVAVSDGAYRVFVDQQYKDDAGKLSPVLKNTKVGTGDTSKAVDCLPAFAVENRKSDDGTQYSSVLIDNVVAYMFQGDLDKAAEYLPKSGEAAVETPAPTEVPKHTATITWDKTTSSATVSTTEETAFDGVLVHMSYNDDNTLKSVKTYDAKGIVKTTPKAVAFDSTDKVYNGDKIVLWNSLESMIPYGSLTVANGETKPTPTPTATATTTATTAPTPTATTTATTAPTPTATTTATTAPTPTAVPTYAVTTAAAQNGTVTVTGADDLTAVTAGTELTITATPNSGFRVGTITVAPTATSSTTVVAVDSNNKFTMPSEAVTVTVTFEDASTPSSSVATLHDTRTTGNVADADLVDGYTVTMASEPDADGVYQINVSGTDLKYHQNGENNMGYWIGVAVTPGLGSTEFTKYALGTTKESVATPANDVPAGDKNPFSYYVDASKDNNKLYFSLKQGERTFIYHINLNVTLAQPEVAKATLSDRATVPTYTDAQLAETLTVTTTPATADVNYDTITLKATDAKYHKNGQGNMGYWLGAAITPPEGTKITNYYFSSTAPAADADTTTWPTVGPTGEDNENCVSFYVNAEDTTVSKYAAVKLSDGKVYLYKIVIDQTSTFANQMVPVAHTAHSQWGSNAAEATADNETEYFNGDSNWNWRGAAYMAFDLTDVDASTLDTATLYYSATSAKNYTSALYYLTTDVVIPTGLAKTDADLFADNRVSVNSEVASVQNGKDLTQDVTAAIKARLAEGATSIVFMITGNNGGASLSGKTSQKAPTLTIQKGEAAGKAIAVTVKDSEGNAVEGAMVTANEKISPASLFSLNPVYITSAKTNASGVANLRLGNGAYTITATKDGKTIKSQDLTVTDDTAATLEVKAVSYAVTVNDIAAITIPKGDTAYTATAAPTFGVTADAVAVSDATVKWSLKAAVTGVSITEAGIISVDKTATAGTATVVATYTTPEGNKVTGEKAVTLSAPAVAAVTVTGSNKVSNTTAAGTGTYTATAADKYGNDFDLTGKTVTWSIEPEVTGAAIAAGEPSTGATLTVQTSVAGDTKVNVVATVDSVKSTAYEVTVTKEATGTITKGTIENGDVTISAEAGVAGDTIVVTPTANTGYRCTGVSFTPAEGTATPATAGTGENEGKYTFAMPTPVKDVTVTATFAKIDYTITNATADANGTISFSKNPANYQDTVEVTVNPGATYELATLKYKGTAEGSTVAETAITKDAETGKYTFTMPAEAVTVTATFDVVPLTRPIPDGNTLIKEFDTTAIKLGNRNVWQPTSGNQDFTPIQNVAHNLVAFDTDILIADTEEVQLTFGRSSSSAFGGQTSTLILTGANGKIAIKGQNGSSNFTGYSYTTGDNDTLSSGTWYRLVVSAVPTGTAYNTKVEIYDVDATTLAVGELKVAGNLTFRTGNNATEWNRIGFGVTGTPSMDNTYVYTPTKYDATVTVTDGTDPLEGVTVTLDDKAASTGTTDSNGQVKFSVVPGTYNVTVAKIAYDAPTEAQQLVVTTEGGAKTVAMTAKTQVLTSLVLSGGRASHEVIATTSDSGKVVERLSAVALDDSGEPMVPQPTITWESDSANTTVTDGVVTITKDQAAGDVKITAKASDTVTAEYTFTVVATGTEIVSFASDDFEGTSIFTMAGGPHIGDFKGGKVLKMGGADNGTATADFGGPVAPETNQTLTVRFDQYCGWLSSGKNVDVNIKNSNGETVLSYSYNTNSCNVTAVTLAGVVQEVTAFNFQVTGSKQNGWGSFTGNPASVLLTLNPDGSVKASFAKSGGTAVEFDVAATDSKLTANNIKSMVMTNHATNDDRSGGFDNIVTTLKTITI